MRPRNRQIFAGAALALILMASLGSAVEADYLTEWVGTVQVLGVKVNPYPAFVAGQSCVSQSSVVYCIGGLNGTGHTTNSTYEAPLSGQGVGQWERLPDYPTRVAGQSCVAYSGYVYCVGGLEHEATANSTSQVISVSYYAPLASFDSEGWTKTTSYPFEVYDQSCAVSSDYIYCIGGVASNSSAVSSVEYSQLSPAGISEWKLATSYPSKIAAESCASYSQRLLCVGGLNATSRAISSVYYAFAEGPNLDWIMGTGYPNPIAGHSCVIRYPDLYCIGGLNATSYATRAVFFSYLNGTGLNWIASVFYPVSVQSQSCVTDSNYIYCIGGYDGLSFLRSIYFASVGTSQPSYSAGSATAASSTRTSISSAERPNNYESIVAVAVGAVVVVMLAVFATRKRLGESLDSEEEQASVSRARA